MKRNGCMLFLSIITPLLISAQTVRTISLEYHKDDFSITEAEGLIYVNTNNFTTILKNDTLDPALPYICLNVLIGPDESFVDFTSTNTEAIYCEGVTIAPNPCEAFNNGEITATPYSLPFLYAKSNYPELQIEYTGTHMMNGYKFLTFLVCPFRYDSTTKRLYLQSRIDLNLQLKTKKDIKLPATRSTFSVEKQKVKDSFFINEEHKSILYGANNANQIPPKSNTTGDYPYKYLIILNSAAL